MWFGASETFGSGSHAGSRSSRTSCPVNSPGRTQVEGFLAALAISFGVIFIAELGDKSQLMALTFATRYRAATVLAGITIATALVHLVSVGVGVGLGSALPTGWIGLAAGVAFLA